MARQIISVGWNSEPPPPFPLQQGPSMGAALQQTADGKHLVGSNPTLGKLAWFDGVSWSAIAAIPTDTNPVSFSPIATKGGSLAYINGSQVIVARAGRDYLPGYSWASLGNLASYAGGSNNSWTCYGGFVWNGGAPYTYNPHLWLADTPDYLWTSVEIARCSFMLHVGFSIYTGQPVGAFASDILKPDLYLFQNGMNCVGYDTASVLSDWVPPGVLQYLDSSGQIQNTPESSIPLTGFFGGGTGDLWFAKCNTIDTTTNQICASDNGGTLGNFTGRLPHALVTGTASNGMPLWTAGTTRGLAVGTMAASQTVAGGWALANPRAVRGQGGILVPIYSAGFALQSVTYYQVDSLGLISGGINVALPAGFPANATNWNLGFVGQAPYLAEGNGPTLYSLAVFSADLEIHAMGNWHLGVPL